MFIYNEKHIMLKKSYFKFSNVKLMLIFKK